jgi:2'-5' RNA ligase
MAYAVMLFFTKEIEDQIVSIWKDLADQEIDGYMVHSGNRPHIKLAIYDEIDLLECRSRLQSLAAFATPFPIDFKFYGIFPNPKPTIFLGPAVTDRLLNFKREVDISLEGLGKSPSYDFFQPGHWIPHCLFAMEMELEKMKKGLDVVMSLPLPLHGMITEIGMIEFFPVNHLFTYRLGN